MSKVSITIECTPKEWEMANFLLEQAYQSAKDNETFQRAWAVTPSELEKGEKFRMIVLTEYLKQ
ncbi:hypothetical protein [Dysgonomonas sp. HGC4]|uniref:hypothetical protein n=1 Tax=Dysgonomonas sp. HGC4 TaxID=1658009 RepID=UPI000682C1A4|nr:hypothetical protein [Dysgonomonas sp. HGC4]MBD8349368.1 hypothetical protein [Dysgonomonas sp. HGC4]